MNGPLLPRPTQLDRSKVIHEATENLTKSLDSAIEKKIKAGFNVDNTSFSIALVSPRQTNKVEGDGNFVLENWRIDFDTIPFDNSAIPDLPGQGKLSNVCASWQTEAWIYYGGEALDRIVFKVDRDAKKVIGVDIPFLWTGLLTDSI